MLNKHNDQLIMEICNEKNNYRIIIKRDNLFDGYSILSQKYKKTEKNKIISVYDLFRFNYIEFETNLELIKLLNNSLS
tara:strand:- start:373 stop:606 length:234 start_codon:yes stop_codon:yes gene_type:complete